jgi:superfamily I DNA/RNA helicase
MQTEFRVIGPPGCGKTTFLSREVTKAVEKYGGDNVMVASLTKTAAAEVAGRGIPINPMRIGTLHAHAYRALGFPKLAENREGIEAWNKDFPSYRLSVPGGAASLDSAVDGFAPMKSPGDKHFSQYNIARARKSPIDELPGAVRRFGAAWESWKKTTGLFDFTDLIDIAASSIHQAPGRPKVIFVDEAQDHDRLELDLVRKWGAEDRGAERLVIVGDPDQNLYEWRGSDPEAFFDPPLPDDQRLVLSQSYRVPKAVHAKATEWIERTAGRDPVKYLPTDDPGEVRKTLISLRDPAGIIRDAEQYTEAGKSVLFLTTCAYMLSPLVNELRGQGIPFHNPYRARSDWNPLDPQTRGTSTLEKFKAYISPLLETEPYAVPWSVDEVQLWTTALARVLKRGKRQVLEGMDPRQGFTPAMLDELFLESADPYEAYNIESGDPSWFQKHIKASANVDYAVKVLSKFGAEAIVETPKISVGTIHSVKGGEADVVYLFPDMSRVGYQSIHTPRGKAATLRQFYVGMTRAKETLVLGGASSQTAVQLGS